MTTTRSLKLQAEELTNNIRDELNRALESDTLINKLVSVLKKTLIEEITPMITKKISENLREYIDFELQARDTQISVLETKMQSSLDQQDESEQYSRRNSLIFNGIKEVLNENTNETIIKMCAEKLDIALDAREIDRSHRLGQSKEKRNRGVIVKFTNYHVREKIYSNRRKLRHCQDEAIYIHESLTRRRTELFWKVKTKYREQVEALWTQDGRILAISKQTKKRITMTTEGDLHKLSKA